MPKNNKKSSEISCFPPKTPELSKLTNNSKKLTKKKRCALKAMASSTALMIFSRMYFGMTKEATMMTIGAEMNLKQTGKGLIIRT